MHSGVTEPCGKQKYIILGDKIMERTDCDEGKERHKDQEGELLIRGDNWGKDSELLSFLKGPGNTDEVPDDISTGWHTVEGGSSGLLSQPQEGTPPGTQVANNDGKW